jgi:hypothetical protein
MRKGADGCVSGRNRNPEKTRLGSLRPINNGPMRLDALQMACPKGGHSAMGPKPLTMTSYASHAEAFRREYC